MLTKRLIAVILLREGRAVKSKRFTAYRDVGDPVAQARVYYANGIDELVILNTEPKKGIKPLLAVLPAISGQCFIPIAAGGGVTSVEDAAALFLAGCEKVVIRTALDAIPSIVERFGRQAVVECRDYHGTPPEAPVRGGEVIYQSIDHDGMRDGYDTAKIVSDVPVVKLGGCGNYEHMAEAFISGADACAAGSLYCFTDSNPKRAKAYLRNRGMNVRSR